MTLIVTGSIGIDSVETPTRSMDGVLGGSSIYFAAAASFFGPVRVVGAVGEDFPDAFMETFRHFGIDQSGIERRTGSQTFRWHGRYMQNMNVRETVSVQLNVLAEDLPTVPESYRDSQYIFLANTDPVSQMQLLSQFPHCKLSVADTMDLWISTQKDQLTQLMKKIDGLVLNSDEAEQLTGETNAVRAAEQILGMGPRFVVVKKGEHGALVVHGGDKVVLPAFPASDVVDPTGAGDSFAGGMMGHLAHTGDLSLPSLRMATAYGTIVASFNIESFSLDRLRQLRRADIDQRLSEYRAMLDLSEGSTANRTAH